MRYELWRGAKVRAKALGVPFSLSLDDILVPEICPVLGLHLAPSSGGQPSPNSPSIDRMIPTWGYIPGNVRVVSYRANVLKADATLEELRLVLADLEDLGDS